MTNSRRAVFVCCDGLGRDWFGAASTPVLHALAGKSVWCADHAAVFPSVTRVSAASIATGCHPGSHGLHGNRMGLIEGGKIKVHDVGKPDFRTQMRRATGRTLRVPTMAERVAGKGGFIAFSNVSPGAAYFLDPDNHGYVYHRAGSFAPGGAPIEGSAALDVSHDHLGDWAMTERFCAEVLADRRPSIAVLWLADPDHTMHHVPLGSPGHVDALRHAEKCVSAVHETVSRLRARGEDILLMVGSDHGHETIGRCIDLENWLSDKGAADLVQQGDIAVAGQGTAALLYATDRGRSALLGLLEDMRAEPWAAGVITQPGLDERGHAAQGGVVAAINMAREEQSNPFGVDGQRWVVAEGAKPPAIGCGQHGGWGPNETKPFLIIDHPSAGAAVIGRSTSLVDIAPTILGFLGQPTSGLDGASLVQI